jgi:hypothetical protein
MTLHFMKKIVSLFIGDSNNRRQSSFFRSSLNNKKGV